MLFQTPQFVAFLLLTLALFYTLPLRARWPLLLVASYGFYGYWNWKFVPLLLGLTIVDYFVALWLERVETRRKIALGVSIAANLGMLGFFKYYNFAGASLAAVLERPAQSFALDIVLPLGISFHTFQSLSYIIDVYRRRQPAIRDFVEYAVFISFFPQLVAGPIVRAHEFFGELWRWRRPAAIDIQEGALLFTLGLVKKTVFADQFATVADAYFSNVTAHPGSLAAWSGVAAFAFQILFDFSGYTDMARGSARLFGFHFPPNFRRPYLAVTITEFWRRWHMTLSRWLRDYLYIPLGGNRGGRLATYRNLLVTMLLGGLWHGASWNFVVWGGYHGALLAAERLWRDGGGPSMDARWLTPFRVVRTFVLVSIGWVFFRAANLAEAGIVLRQMASGTAGQFLLNELHLMLMAAACVIAIADEHWSALERLVKAPSWIQAPVYTVLLLMVDILAAPGDTTPFIYFQF